MKVQNVKCKTQNYGCNYLRIKTSIFLLLILVILLLCGRLWADGLADSALKRGIGTRAAGMGNAYTGVAEDGSAIFFNPAALSDPGLSYAYGNPDTTEKLVAGAWQFLKLGYLGYANWRMQENTTNEIATGVLAFGNRSGPLSWGISYKASNWNLAGSGNNGWSGDIGFMLRLTPQLKLGLLAQDVLASKGMVVPASCRLGVGLKPLDGALTLAGDVEIYNNLQTFSHLGLEVRMTEGMVVRGGLDRGEATAGLSLDFKIFNLDYAALFTQAGQTIQKVEAGIKLLPQSSRPFSMLKPREYVLLDVSGAIQGGRTQYSLFGGVRPGLDSILADIRNIEKDKGIDGIMLKVGGMNGGLGGMAVVQEIRQELLRARQQGKKIVAYVDGSAMGDEYYLVAVADKIIAPPGAAIGGLGKSVEIYRISGLFDKIGIEWQVLTQGNYKAAFDPYNPKMTAEQKGMVQGLLSDLYRKMIVDVASDRRLQLDKVKKIGDSTFMTARQAKEQGLIDEIGYYKDARKAASALFGDDKDEAKIVEIQQVVAEDYLFSRVFGMAVIEIDGEIVSGSSGENILFGGRQVGPESVVKYIRQASDDVFVKAIILRINSSGGDAIAAGEIYNALQYARNKQKVIVASIGDIGASGGYYIACAADKIVADPASITGSIGVIGYFPVYEKLLKKLNMKADVIKEGQHADMFSGLRKLTSKEVEAMVNMQEEAYDEFIQAVVAGRKLATREVKAIAQGKIYTGSQALDLKLVDKLGSFADAVDLAKDEAKIAGEPRLLFYTNVSPFFKFGEGLTESLGVRDLTLW